MKKNILILFVLITNMTSWAQSPPQKLSYQTVVRNSSNALLANTAIGMRISVLQFTSAGSAVYVETQTPTSNSAGLVSIEIGGGTPSSGTFSAINWKTGPYFVKTEIDPLGGSAYTISSTSQLQSAAYALYAKTADNDFSGDYNALTNKPISGTNTGDMRYWNGTDWALIPVGLPNQALQLSATNVPTWVFTKPTLTTTSISAITSTTATSGGTILDDGGSAITAKGVCWSTSNNPTTANSTTANGSGSGSFTSSITGLTLNTPYYVRAYATNSIGTSYGVEYLFTPPPLIVGNAYQGGIVAYILQSGDPGYDANVQHGIIAAPSDQNTGIRWAFNGIIGAFGAAIGTGLTNTNAIVADQGAGTYAAKLCSDLVLGGYSDWFLPSKNELGKLYSNRVAVGGFSTDYYWSSTEEDNSLAWAYNFTNGATGFFAKGNTYTVRAVRAF